MQEGFYVAIGETGLLGYLDPAESENACFQAEILTGSAQFKMAAKMASWALLAYLLFVRETSNKCRGTAF